MALKEFDLRFEDTTIHCWEGGAGFPVLRLHGSGAGASIPGNYRRVIEPLSKKYRVLASDLVGFGLSGRKPAKPYFDMELWLRQAGSLLARLGTGEVGVIGHSISGALALKLAARHPQITKVLTTGTMGTSFPCKPGTRLWRYPEGKERLRQSIETTVWNKSLIDDAEVDYRHRILTQPGYREYYEAMFDGDKQHYIDISAVTGDELKRIEADVMMMHGRHDVSFPAEDTCLVLAKSLPADVWLVENCAHSVALEHPEKFLAAADLLFAPAARRES
jgi:2-hydroxymuconate-semialdehyde hydrolase